jgi:hypothetical protein
MPVTMQFLKALVFIEMNWRTLMNTIQASEIKPNMSVVCSLDGEFAKVDHMEGDKTIKLMKDKEGQHHFIPLSWVTSTENNQVKVDRPGEQAMKDWSITAPIV